MKAQPGWDLLLSSLTWVLSGLRSFWALGLRASVPGWILATPILHSLPCGSPQQGNLLHQSQHWEPLLRGEVRCCCNLIKEMTSHQCCWILFGVWQITQEEGTIYMVWTPEGGIGDHYLRGCLAQASTNKT